ncbi:MAG: hypothetical protein GY835_20010 [bacterium]|nr:hypothetical protein [bacterium]
MARFRFRLAKVLKLRERAEQDASRILSRILSLKQACLNKIESMQTSRYQLAEIRNELQRGQVNPPSIAQNRYQIIILEKGIFMEERKLRMIEIEEENARKVLLERSRERKLLEKYEERQREEFRLEEQQRENREQDERPLPRRNSTPVRGMGIAMNPENAHTR